MPEVRILPLGVPDNFRAYEFSSTQWLDSILIFLGWDFLAGIKAVFGRRLLSFLLWRQGCLWYLTQDPLNFRSCALVWGLILSPWISEYCSRVSFSFSVVLSLASGGFIPDTRLSVLTWCDVGPLQAEQSFLCVAHSFPFFFFLLTLAALVPLNPSIAPFSGRLCALLGSRLSAESISWLPRVLAHQVLTLGPDALSPNTGSLRIKRSPA